MGEVLRQMTIRGARHKIWPNIFYKISCAEFFNKTNQNNYLGVWVIKIKNLVQIGSGNPKFSIFKAGMVWGDKTDVSFLPWRGTRRVFSSQLSMILEIRLLFNNVFPA